MLGLNLPVDIPWERIAASEDMIVRAPFDGTVPRRWRSSIAVFDYEPGAEYQIYSGSVVSYVKVVASITGFQPDGNEIGLYTGAVSGAWTDPAVIESFDATVGAYFPCYGAIVEVVVLPGDSDGESLPVSEYPYIADFEPKKRELYELVSDTGEVMSRSLESVNVRKGTTTTDGSERVDTLGFGIKAEAGSETSKGRGSGEFAAGSSSKNIGGEEFTNIRDTQSDREMREAFSHSTQLTQMYHQLNSYHQGTNRAMFFMLPRPHVVQTERSFVNGPRVMEGMQEFFVVVMRPAKVKKLCVHVLLETAHLSPVTDLSYERSSATCELHLFQPAPQPRPTIHDDDVSVPRSGSSTFVPPDGWQIDVDRLSSPVAGKTPTKGYQEESESHVNLQSASVSVAADRLTLNATVVGKFEDNTLQNDNNLQNKSTDGRIDWTVTVFLRRRQPTVAVTDQTLYLTGRTATNCPSHVVEASDYIAWEGPIQNSSGRKPGVADSLYDVNRFREDIGATIRQSVSHPSRYAPRSVRFAESQLVADVLSRKIAQGRHPDNIAAGKIKGVDPAIARKLNSAKVPKTRADLLNMSLARQVRELGLSRSEAIGLRRVLLGLT